MAFPTTLDSFTTPAGTDYLSSPPHATQHSSLNTAVAAIEAKVGINSSAVTTSHDYKLSSVTSTAKAVSTAGDQTVAGNKTFSGTNTHSGANSFTSTVAVTGKTTLAQVVNTITTATDGATVTFNCSLGNIFTVTLGGNRTLALSNVVAGQAFIIRLVQDGTGSRTVTWFSTIKWPDATTPTLTTTASKTDVFGFICTSAGNYDGYIVGQNL